MLLVRLEFDTIMNFVSQNNQTCTLLSAKLFSVFFLCSCCFFVRISTRLERKVSVIKIESEGVSALYQTLSHV